MRLPVASTDYSAREAAQLLGMRSPNQLHNDRRTHDLELDLDANELRPLPKFGSEAERRTWYASHVVYSPKYAALKLPGHDWKYERAWIDGLAACSTLARTAIFAGALERAAKTLSADLGRPIRVVNDTTTSPRIAASGL